MLIAVAAVFCLILPVPALFVWDSVPRVVAEVVYVVAITVLYLL
jgi:hypothetical protein